MTCAGCFGQRKAQGQHLPPAGASCPPDSLDRARHLLLHRPDFSCCAGRGSRGGHGSISYQGLMYSMFPQFPTAFIKAGTAWVTGQTLPAVQNEASVAFMAAYLAKNGCSVCCCKPRNLLERDWDLLLHRPDSSCCKGSVDLCHHACLRLDQGLKHIVPASLCNH